MAESKEDKNIFKLFITWKEEDGDDEEAGSDQAETEEWERMMAIEHSAGECEERLEAVHPSKFPAELVHWEGDLKIERQISAF
jgi:hypothetical protein